MGWTGIPEADRSKTKHVLAHELRDDEVIAIGQGRDGNVYAAIRSDHAPAGDVLGIVVLTRREGGYTYTKPVTETMGPVHFACPASVLDALDKHAPLPEATDDEPSSLTYARMWRAACRKRSERRTNLSSQLTNGTVVRFDRAVWGEDIGDTFTVVRTGPTGRKVRFLNGDGRVLNLRSYTSVPFTIVEDDATADVQAAA